MNTLIRFKHTQAAIDYQSELQLLQALVQVDILPNSRAQLFFPCEYQGIRMALQINLGDELKYFTLFDSFKCLWLVELDNHKVFLYGSHHRDMQRSIGGRSIRHLDILDSNAYWLNTLAVALTNTVIEQGINKKLNIPKSKFTALAKIEFRILQKAIQAFVSQLDEHIILALKAEKTGSNIIYNQYISDNNEQQRNRIQATIAYPAFSHTLRNNWSLKQMVDNGQSLLNELSNIFQVKKNTIKQCRFISNFWDSTQSQSSVLKLLDRYSADYFPKNAFDQQTFLALAVSLNDLANTLQVEPTQLAHPFKKGWYSGMQSLDYILKRTMDIEAVLEMMHISYQYGVKPLLQNDSSISNVPEKPPLKWFASWFGDYGLKRLLIMGYEWERLYCKFSLQRLKVNSVSQPVLTWPTLIESDHSRGNYRVIELTSQQLLESEGRRLDHCVASYAFECLMAGSFIYSIRDRQHNALSTFEVKFSNNKPEIIQHKAQNNDDPSNDEVLTAQLFVNTVLNHIPMKQLEAVITDRYERGKELKNKLPKTNTLEDKLSSNELKRLSEMVEFTHPTKAKKIGIVKYFKHYVIEN